MTTDDRLDLIHADVMEVKDLARATNGRVTAIEKARLYEAGEAAAMAKFQSSTSRRTAEYVGWLIAVVAIGVGAYT